MVIRLTMGEAIERLAALPARLLVGIDGLPCSGKSTLVDQVAARSTIASLSLDDFVLPRTVWPADIRPAFPFAYVRHAEFFAAVRELHETGSATITPFDWDRYRLGTPHRLERGNRALFVEGVSALAAELVSVYDLKVFVESDRTTVLAAARARGLGPWADEWPTLFLPSADLYMATQPQARADWIVAGRGARAGGN